MITAHPRSTPLAAALACALLAACQVRFTDQDVALRHHPESDHLELLLVYRGVTAPDDEETSLNRAVEFVREMVFGRRRLSICDWPFSIDFDDPDEIAAPGGDLAWVRDHLHLLDARAYVDADGRLAGSQSFRLDGASEALRRANAAISRALLEAEAEEKLDEALHLLDPDTRLRWREQAESGRAWIQLREGQLVVDLPAPSPRDIARIIHEMLGMKPHERAALASLLSAVEFPGDRVLLTLGHPEGDATLFHFHNPQVTYHSSLAARLQGEGLLDG